MRPLVQYWVAFTHPDRTDPLMVPAPGDTPCHARNEAWVRLERLKQTDPTLPQDNAWRMQAQTPA